MERRENARARADVGAGKTNPKSKSTDSPCDQAPAVFVIALTLAALAGRGGGGAAHGRGRHGDCERSRPRPDCRGALFFFFWCGSTLGCLPYASHTASHTGAGCHPASVYVLPSHSLRPKKIIKTDARLRPLPGASALRRRASRTRAEVSYDPYKGVCVCVCVCLSVAPGDGRAHTPYKGCAPPPPPTRLATPRGRWAHFAPPDATPPALYAPARERIVRRTLYTRFRLGARPAWIGGPRLRALWNLRLAPCFCLLLPSPAQNHTAPASHRHTPHLPAQSPTEAVT